MPISTLLTKLTKFASGPDFSFDPVLERDAPILVDENGIVSINYQSQKVKDAFQKNIDAVAKSVIVQGYSRAPHSKSIRRSVVLPPSSHKNTTK